MGLVQLFKGGTGTGGGRIVESWWSETWIGEEFEFSETGCGGVDENGLMNGVCEGESDEREMADWEIESEVEESGYEILEKEIFLAIENPFSSEEGWEVVRRSCAGKT
jgi:hypothetical protein